MRGDTRTTILVTGGAGFIGAYLCRWLAEIGFNVIAADAFRPYAVPKNLRHRAWREALLEGAQVERIDLLDRDAAKAILDKVRPRVVINLAANPIVGSASRDPRACERDIVESARNLTNAVVRSGSVARLVQVSSSMVYGDFASGSVDEDSPTTPVNAYGHLKLAAEDLVRAISNDVETVVVRPMAVYGCGDGYNRVVPKFCANAIAGLPLDVYVTPETLIDFSYVSDVAEGIALAALEPTAAGETFNISYGEARSLLDLVTVLQQHFPNLRYEVFSADHMLRLRRGALDISKARRLLGYRPAVSLEDGIARCIAYLRGSKEIASGGVMHRNERD